MQFGRNDKGTISCFSRLVGRMGDTHDDFFHHIEEALHLASTAVAQDSSGNYSAAYGRKVTLPLRPVNIASDVPHTSILFHFLYFIKTIMILLYFHLTRRWRNRHQEVHKRARLSRCELCMTID